MVESPSPKGKQETVETSKPQPTAAELLPLANKAKQACKAYLAKREAEYKKRQKWRKKNRIPVLALCGYGRAGKDYSAKYICAVTRMIYGGSTSSNVVPIVATALKQPVKEAFEERHNNRMFWFEFCNALRAEDPTLLARLNLGGGDMVIGIRSELELHACVASGVVDYTVWIDNPRAECDPTVEYGPEDCHLTLSNCGSRLQLFEKLDKLLDLMSNKYF